MNAHTLPNPAVVPALVATFLTGAAGLVHQLVWQRYLSRLLGSDGVSTALVLAVFLGGLSLGYALCGAWSRRARNLLATYGWIEVAIGAWALAFPWIYAAADRLTAGWSFDRPGWLLAQGTLTAIFLIAPPTLAMGATVPMLTRALSISVDIAPRIHARVYGINTLGAVAGPLLAGFALIPALGLPATIRVAGLANLVAGVYFLNAGRGDPTEPSDSPTMSPAPGVYPTWILHTVVFIAGFYFMTVESLMIRMTGLTLGSSTYSFALVVSAFVASIAAGALVVAWRRSVRSTALWWNQAAVTVGLTALLLTLDRWPYFAHLIRLQFGRSADAMPGYYTAVFAVLCLVFLCPVGCMGATLPIAFHLRSRSLTDLGAQAGGLLAWNAAGNLLGGLVGGYMLFEWLGSGEVLLVAISAAVSTAAILVTRLPRPHACATAGLFALAVLLVWSFPYDPFRFSVGTFRIRESLAYSDAGADAFYREFYCFRSVLALREDPDGTFAVVENPFPEEALIASLPGLASSALAERSRGGPRPRSIIVNGKADSSTFYDLDTLKLSAHLPALLAPARHRVLVVGLGTGVTAGEFMLYPDVESVAALEISRAIVDFLPSFGPHTGDVHRDPRFEVTVADAFRYIRRSRETWDIITSEPSNPWMSGIDQVFSREFYREVRKHLAPGGVFVQWAQRYATSREIMDVIHNTLAAEFPHVRLFRSRAADDLWVASLEPLGPEVLTRGGALLYGNVPLQDSLGEIDILDMTDLLSRETALPPARTEAGLETLDRPRLHYLANRAFFTGESLDTAELDLRSPLAPAPR